MTERVPPLNLQNSTTHTAAGDRALIYSLYGGREGTMGAADLAVTQNGTPNMSVNIAAGRAVVLGDTSADQQLYHVWNDATVNKTISAADPTNPRRDLIIAEVRDHQIDGGGSNDWRLRVVTGTPAASPADPSTPVTALVLARVTVAAAATSITNANITDLRNRAGTPSSVDVVCTSTTRPANPFQGMKIYETDTYKTLQYTTASTGWQLPWGQPWGRVGTVQSAAVDQNFPSTEADMTGMSISLPAIQNRLYMVTMYGQFYSTGGIVNATFSITNASNTRIGQGISNHITNGTSSQVAFRTTAEFTGAANATTTVKGRAKSDGGNTVVVWNSNIPARLVIDDIGPAGNPV